MKKDARKLKLSRETLRRLQIAGLERAIGGAQALPTGECDTNGCGGGATAGTNCESISCLGGVPCYTGGFTVCC